MTQSIWSKLFTALRGGANEVGESIVDQPVSYTHLTLPTSDLV